MQTTPHLTHRHVLVVVDRDFSGECDSDLPRIATIVAGADVRLVAPAVAVPGEGWIADRSGRDAQARRRLAGWSEALAGYAGSVVCEVGDPDARLALADALAACVPDAVIAIGRPAARVTAAWTLPRVNLAWPRAARLAQVSGGR